MTKSKEPWAERWTKVNKEGSRGGQGEVVKVRSKTDPDGPIFALKVFHSGGRKTEEEIMSRRRRAANEIASLRELKGDGVPELIDDNGEQVKNPEIHLFMVTSWVDGETLEARVERGGPLHLDEALAMISKLCQTVSRCHDLDPPILHRDIKPDNIMLRSSDFSDPVLIDFGLSYRDGLPDKATFAGEQLGNRVLLLPELWDTAGSRSLVQSDVAYLAGVFWYAVSGSKPGVLIDEDFRLPHRRSTKVPDLTELQNVRIAHVLDRAFQQSPIARHGSVQIFLEELLLSAQSESDPSISSASLGHQAALLAAMHPLVERRREMMVLFESLHKEWQRPENQARIRRGVPSFPGGRFDINSSMVEGSGKSLKIVVSVQFWIDNIGSPGEEYSSFARIYETPEGLLGLHVKSQGSDDWRDVIVPVGTPGSAPFLIEKATEELATLTPELCRLALASSKPVPK